MAHEAVGCCFGSVTTSFPRLIFQGVRRFHAVALVEFMRRKDVQQVNIGFHDE